MGCKHVRAMTIITISDNSSTGTGSRMQNTQQLLLLLRSRCSLPYRGLWFLHIHRACSNLVEKGPHICLSHCCLVRNLHPQVWKLSNLAETACERGPTGSTSSFVMESYWACSNVIRPFQQGNIYYSRLHPCSNAGSWM
jgi:hypothetical protein